MIKTISKAKAKKSLGIRTDDELAAEFGIKRQAVQAWVNLPVRRYLELRVKYPRRFPEPRA